MLAFPKPARGSRVLDKERQQAEAATIEKREKAAAKKRDGRCRWPEAHKCRCGIESAHLVDASRGGKMHRSNLITLCSWLHRRGPESIHGKQLQIVPETKAGADGPCAFYRRGLDGGWYLVARELAVNRIERD